MYELEYEFRNKVVIINLNDENEAVAYAKLLRKFGQSPWLHYSWYEYDFEKDCFEHAGL